MNKKNLLTIVASSVLTLNQSYAESSLVLNLSPSPATAQEVSAHQDSSPFVIAWAEGDLTSQELLVKFHSAVPRSRRGPYTSARDYIFIDAPSADGKKRLLVRHPSQEKTGELIALINKSKGLKAAPASNELISNTIELHAKSHKYFKVRSAKGKPSQKFSALLGSYGHANSFSRITLIPGETDQYLVEYWGGFKVSYIIAQINSSPYNLLGDDAIFNGTQTFFESREGIPQEIKATPISDGDFKTIRANFSAQDIQRLMPIPVLKKMGC